jgi:hypothetical protein
MRQNLSFFETSRQRDLGSREPIQIACIPIRGWRGRFSNDFCRTERRRCIPGM